MNRVDITKIEVLESGEIAVYPSMSSPDYQFVYRDASGVYWDNEHQRFYAKLQGYDAKALAHLDWFKNIIGAVSSELGIGLAVTHSTQWINVLDSQQQLISTFSQTYRF